MVSTAMALATLPPRWRPPCRRRRWPRRCLPGSNRPHSQPVLVGAAHGAHVGIKIHSHVRSPPSTFRRSLPAGSLDVRAQRPPHRGGDAPWPPAGRQSAFAGRSRFSRYPVPVTSLTGIKFTWARIPLEPARQLPGAPVHVVDAADHGVLKGDAPPCRWSSNTCRPATAPPCSTACSPAWCGKRISSLGACRDTGQGQLQLCGPPGRRSCPPARRWKGRCAASPR